MICVSWIEGPGAFISLSYLSSVLKSLNIFEEAAMHPVVTFDPLVSPNGNPDIGAALNIAH